MEPGSPEAHIDMHFRLLRQDLITPLAGSVQSFIDAGGIAQAAHAPKRGTRAKDDNELAVYLDARVVELVTETAFQAPCDMLVKVTFRPAARHLRGA